jgi:hypothetical protein
MLVFDQQRTKLEKDRIKEKRGGPFLLSYKEKLENQKLARTKQHP